MENLPVPPIREPFFSSSPSTTGPQGSWLGRAWERIKEFSGRVVDKTAGATDVSAKKVLTESTTPGVVSQPESVVVDPTTLSQILEEMRGTPPSTTGPVRSAEHRAAVEIARAKGIKNFQTEIKTTVKERPFTILLRDFGKYGRMLSITADDGGRVDEKTAIKVVEAAIDSIGLSGMESSDVKKYREILRGFLPKGGEVRGWWGLGHFPRIKIIGEKEGNEAKDLKLLWQLKDEMGKVKTRSEYLNKLFRFKTTEGLSDRGFKKFFRDKGIATLEGFYEYLPKEDEGTSTFSDERKKNFDAWLKRIFREMEKEDLKSKTRGSGSLEELSMLLVSDEPKKLEEGGGSEPGTGSRELPGIKSQSSGVFLSGHVPAHTPSPAESAVFSSDVEAEGSEFLDEESELESVPEAVGAAQGQSQNDETVSGTIAYGQEARQSHYDALDELWKEEGFRERFFACRAKIWQDTFAGGGREIGISQSLDAAAFVKALRASGYTVSDGLSKDFEAAYESQEPQERREAMLRLLRGASFLDTTDHLSFEDVLAPARGEEDNPLPAPAPRLVASPPNVSEALRGVDLMLKSALKIKNNEERKAVVLFETAELFSKSFKDSDLSDKKVKRLQSQILSALQTTEEERE